MSTMKPLRLTMIHQRPLERLAPRTQDASVAAVVGLAKFYWCSPDQLNPEQIRAYLPHLLVERQLAWSTWNQVACGLRFFSIKTLGWEPLHLNLPPRTRRLPLPHVLSAEELQRLFISAKNPKHRALLITTYAAGLRVSAVVHLQVTAIEAARGLIRVNQGQGRKDRYTLLSARLLAELRAYWTLERCKPWLFPGQTATNPCRSTVRSAFTPRPNTPPRFSTAQASTRYGTPLPPIYLQPGLIHVPSNCCLDTVHSIPPPAPCA